MIAQVPSTRYQPTRREISALLLTMQGEEVTAEGMAAFFNTMEPIIHFIHFGGQRWKDPNKLTKNTLVTVSRRTITASVTATGYAKMNANWIYRDASLIGHVPAGPEPEAVAKAEEAASQPEAE
jgi:hypothetical protein